MKRALAFAAGLAALGVAWFALREPPSHGSKTERDTARPTPELANATEVVLEAASIAPSGRETAAGSRESQADEHAEPDASSIDRTPRISGRVLDQDGAPVWNALVQAQPVGAVAPGAAERDAEFTARDGTFTIELHSNVRHWLWIENLEFSAWSSWLTATPDFATGTRDVVIRLQRRRVAHIHVVDALTHVVLPSVELRAIEVPVCLPEGANPEVRAQRRPIQLAHGVEPLEAQDATGVEFRLEDPPQTVFCWAPGHAAALVELTSESEQTVPLAPCGSIRGAITFAGRQRDVCSIRVRRQSTGSRIDDAQRVVEVELDDASRFSADELAPGEYDAFAVLPERFGRVPLVLRTSVSVAAGALVELGAIDVGAPDPEREVASLRLMLKLPAGLDPTDVVNEIDVSVNGWRVQFDDNPFQPGTALRLARVPSGRAVCEFPMRTPSLAPRRSAAIELGASGEHELAFDLSDLPLCRLDVHAEASSLGEWFFARYASGEAVALQAFTHSRAPFTLRAVVRGGERVVVERRNAVGEVTWRSVPLDVPRTSERLLEVNAP